MSIPVNNLLSVYSQKKFGRRCEYGRGMYGESRFGDQHMYLEFDDGKILELSGIHRKYHTSEGYENRVVNYYITKNPRTILQQSNRSKFSDAVSAWQNLTFEQKKIYNKKAKSLKMSGYNYFLKKFMLS